jgi:hypothetical protein
MVTFYNRDGKWVERPLPSENETLPPLPYEAYEEDRAAARPTMTSTVSKAKA